jgi:predicted RNA-binding Zn ribbon-like protein
MVTPLPPSNAACTGRWRPEHFVAGDAALELANTVAHRRDPTLAEDRIADPRDLADWARSLGIDAEAAPASREEVPRIHAVRQVVHDAFAAIAAGQAPPRTAVAAVLRAAAEGFEAVGRAPPPLHAALAWRAVVALSALPRDRVGACPSCGWLFLDTSRSGRRRWCSMATCGTTGKVRAFRSRRGTVRSAP